MPAPFSCSYLKRETAKGDQQVRRYSAEGKAPILGDPRFDRPLKLSVDGHFGLCPLPAPLRVQRAASSGVNDRCTSLALSRFVMGNHFKGIEKQEMFSKVLEVNRVFTFYHR